MSRLSPFTKTRPRYATLTAGLVAVVALTACSSSSSPSAGSSSAATTAASSAPASSTAPTGAPTEVTLLLPGVASATVGGYLAAVTSDVAKQENLKITVVNAGASTFNTIPQLASGKYQFTLSQLSNVLVSRSQNVPLVELFAPHGFPSCAMAHADQGIKTFADLKGHTVAVAPGATWWTFIKAKYHLDDVQTVAYSGSIAPFLANDKLVTQCYINNEPYQAKLKGAAVTVLPVADAGFNPYSDALITTESVIKDHADLVSKLVKAVVAGWTSYLADPTPTFDLLKASYGDTATREQQQYAFDALKPLNTSPLGSAADANVKSVADTMLDIKAISAATAADYAKSYTNEFLPK